MGPRASTLNYHTDEVYGFLLFCVWGISFPKTKIMHLIIKGLGKENNGFLE